MEVKMTIEYLRENGYDCMGVCEPVKVGRKYVNQTVEGLRLWKCEGRFYWVEGDKCSIVYNSQLDDPVMREKNELREKARQ